MYPACHRAHVAYRQTHARYRLPPTAYHPLSAPVSHGGGLDGCGCGGEQAINMTSALISEGACKGVCLLLYR